VARLEHLAAEIERLDDLLAAQRAREVLLVREDEDGGAREFLLREELRELLAAVAEAAAVGGVDDPDEAVRRLEVVAPVGADRLLAADVPDVELVAARAGRGGAGGRRWEEERAAGMRWEGWQGEERGGGMAEQGGRGGRLKARLSSPKRTS
jgi:hypothetical protein